MIDDRFDDYDRTGLPRHLAEEIGMPRGGAELVLWCADPEPAVETEDVSWAWQHPAQPASVLRCR